MHCTLPFSKVKSGHRCWLNKKELLVIQYPDPFPGLFNAVDLTTGRVCFVKDDTNVVVDVPLVERRAIPVGHYFLFKDSICLVTRRGFVSVDNKVARCDLKEKVLLITLDEIKFSPIL